MLYAIRLVRPGEMLVGHIGTFHHRSRSDCLQQEQHVTAVSQKAKQATVGRAVSNTCCQNLSHQTTGHTVLPPRHKNLVCPPPSPSLSAHFPPGRFPISISSFTTFFNIEEIPLIPTPSWIPSRTSPKVFKTSLPAPTPNRPIPLVRRITLTRVSQTIQLGLGYTYNSDNPFSGLDSVEKKYGGGKIDPAKSRGINEKVTDGARDFFEKSTG